MVTRISSQAPIVLCHFFSAKDSKSILCEFYVQVGLFQDSFHCKTDSRGLCMDEEGSYDRTKENGSGPSSTGS